MEDEDVTLDIQTGVVRELRLLQFVSFLLSEIQGSAIYGRADDIIIIEVAVHVASLDRPADEGVETGHRANNGILASLIREPAFRN